MRFMVFKIKQNKTENYLKIKKNYGFEQERILHKTYAKNCDARRL